MEKVRGNPDKLVPFKKGADERRNVAGRPEGSQTLKAILERLLEKKVTVEDLGTKVVVTRKEAIALNMIVTAISEEDPNIMLKAAKQVFENTDPIAKDVNLNGNLAVGGDKELTPEQTAALVKMLQGE
jgi:hypothetical protein